MWVCPYTCTRSHKSALNIFSVTIYLLNLFFAVNVSHGPEAHSSARLAGSTCLYLLSSWNTGFYVDAVDSDTGPQACPASTSLTEPSLKLVVGGVFWIVGCGQATLFLTASTRVHSASLWVLYLPSFLAASRPFPSCHIQTPRSAEGRPPGAPC